MPEESLKDSKTKRVLIIRSAPTWLFEKVLNIIKNKGDVTVDVYCPKAVIPQLAQCEELTDIFDDNWEGFYKYSFVTSDLIEKLKKKNYNHIIILYNDTFGEGYGPLRKLAFKAKPGKVSTVNVNMVFSGLKSEGILGRYFLPRKWFYNLMVITFAVEIIVTTIWDRSIFMAKKILSIKPELPKRHKR